MCVLRPLDNTSRTHICVLRPLKVKVDLEEKEEGVVWAGLIWLRVGTSGGLLVWCGLD
jgi:hypothetical protein